MAAALNGVKGWSITLDKRRGWKNPIAKAAFQARISEKALSALISAMESALPMFRRYLKCKASLLGIKKCSFYDIFAPAGKLSSHYNWKEACSVVEDQFRKFDPLMADFAKNAFSSAWVDALPREGKIGGAYCTSFPLSQESRILCNFDGTFNSVCTLAHETGHAWHHEIVKKLSRLLSAYPMTLAETASTFAETLVFEGALKTASSADHIILLEENIQSACQLIVDILSRFYFEKSLFALREKNELPPDELSALMLDAQKQTYGDGLCEMHPYMWVVKPHYYSPHLAFYNFPYAFGELFSLALYNRATKEPDTFPHLYREILSLTGKASAADVARHAGFNIEKIDFWQQGLSVIEKNIIAFEDAVNVKRGSK
jgi:pepF/M3 family oligoendopeptidase